MSQNQQQIISSIKASWQSRTAVIVCAMFIAALTMMNSFWPRKVNAQENRIYTSKMIVVNTTTADFPANLSAELNKRANGQELISVIGTDRNGQYLAIYKK